MLVNQLWKVNIKYKEGTYEGFHLQKRYETEPEVEFLFQIHFKHQRKNESIIGIQIFYNLHKFHYYINFILISLFSKKKIA